MAPTEPVGPPVELLRPALLLLLAEEPAHGYALVDRLRALGWSDSSTGSLYRELRRMEDDGLVHSYWEASQTRGPARRVYEPTREGRRALARSTDHALDLQLYLEGFRDRTRIVGQRLRRVRA